MNMQTLETHKLGGMQSINGFYLYVTFEFDQSVAGVTTINWKSYLGTSGQHSATSAGAELFLEITGIQGTPSVTEIEAIPWLAGDKYYNFHTYSANKTVVKSGSFTYSHNSSGKASFDVKLNANIAGVQDDAYNNFLDTTTKITLTDNMPYTKCGAPTSVSASGIITPNGTFTVSWSGASDGTSNKIKEYEVYYRITPDGSAPTTSTYTGKKTVSTTSKSGSTTFPVTNAARGDKIVCGVVTKGQVPGYDSSIKTGGSVTINKLPATPNYSVNKTLVPYNRGSGGSVTFTFSGGSDPDGGNVTYSYSTSENGQKNDLGSGVKTLTVTVNKETTYYFWSKDNCNEYSKEYTQQKILVNSKPTMSMNFSVNNSSNFLVSSFKVTFTPDSNGQSSNNKYTFGYKIGNVSTNLVADTTSTSYTIGDIRKRLTPLNPNTTYNISFFATRKDNLGDISDSVTATYSFKTPTIILRNDNLENTYFSKLLNVTISGHDKGTYTLAKTGEAAVISATQLNTENVGYGNKIEQLNFSGGFAVKTSNTLTKVKAFDFSLGANKTHPFSNNFFKVYTDSALNVSFVGKFGPEYGITSIPSLKLTFKEVSGTMTQSSQSSSNDTFSYSFDGKKLWNNFFTNIQNKVDQEVQAVFSLTNDFGNTFTSNSFSLNLNFNGSITVIDASCLLHTYDTYTKDGNIYKCLLEDWNYLKEEMNIYADLKVYSFYPVTAQVQTKKSSGAVWENFGSSFALTASGTMIENEDYNTDLTEYSITDQLVASIGYISETSIQDFRISFSAAQSDSVSHEKSTNVEIRAHRIPTYTFSQIYYTDEKLTFSFTNITNGKLEDGSTLKKVSIIIDETKTTVDDITATDGVYSIAGFSSYFKDSSGKVFEFLHIAPIFESQQTTSLKSSVSNSVTEKYLTEKTTQQYLYSVIYNISPTVAYRKNHIGINTQNFSDDSNEVVVISNYGNRYLICLKSAEHTATIDLKTGELTEFDIDCGDCGEWS